MKRIARSYRRVFHLARLAERAPEDVLATLRSHGISVQSVNDLVDEARLGEIDKILGIDRLVQAAHRFRPAPASLVVPQVRAKEKPSKPSAPKPRLPKWDTVGQPTNQILYISADQVAQIHWILVDDFLRAKDPIDPPGVKSQNLLESALHRPRTSLGGESKYPTVPMVAAAVLHAIIGNHPFHNGNKRTALVSMLAFLDVNGFLLEADEAELFDYVLRIAAHRITGDDISSDTEMLEIAKWIHRHSRPISNQEKVLKFHDLRSILLHYGCRFSQPRKGNRINIIRGTRSTQVYYRNEGTDVERNTIRQIRRDLRLTDQDGYDSAIFYNAADRVPAFILRYRRTLDRLARV